MKFIVVGDVMIDVVTVLQGEMRYADDTRAIIEFRGGGSAANVASWMAVDGIEPHLFCAIGADRFGRTAVEDLSEAGVRVHAQHVEQPTGAVVALIDAAGERTMFTSTLANTSLRPDTLNGSVEPGDHVHISGYLLLHPQSRQAALSCIRYAKEHGAAVSVDPASARLIEDAGADEINRCLELVDLLIDNEIEAIVLAGVGDPYEAARVLSRRFRTAIVKLGEQGAIVWQGEECITEPALRVTVVDTLGAGDAFAASAIVAWANALPMQQVLREGNRNGARAVSIRGARPVSA